MVVLHVLRDSERDAISEQPLIQSKRIYCLDTKLLKILTGLHLIYTGRADIW